MGRSEADHRQWTNTFFADQGLFTLQKAHEAARYFRRGSQRLKSRCGRTASTVRRAGKEPTDPYHPMSPRPRHRRSWHGGHAQRWPYIPLTPRRQRPHQSKNALTQQTNLLSPPVVSMRSIGLEVPHRLRATNVGIPIIGFRWNKQLFIPRPPTLIRRKRRLR